MQVILAVCTTEFAVFAMIEREITVVKKVDFSNKPSSAYLEDAVYTAPTPQQCQAAPPGTLTREHRTGPRSGHRRDSPSRIGSASPPPQPVLHCKRRSQLSQNRTPVGPHVLHSFPCRYGEGDLNAVADRADLPAGDGSEQPSKRRASARAAAWWTLSPYRSMNFTRPMTELKAGFT